VKPHIMNSSVNPSPLISTSTSTGYWIDIDITLVVYFSLECTVIYIVGNN